MMISGAEETRFRGHVTAVHISILHSLLTNTKQLFYTLNTIPVPSCVSTPFYIHCVAFYHAEDDSRNDSKSSKLSPIKSYACNTFDNWNPFMTNSCTDAGYSSEEVRADAAAALLWGEDDLAVGKDATEDATAAEAAGAVVDLAG